jgi:hypothetical protein
MARKTQTIEQLDASIKRWKTRLRRAVNTLGVLEKKRNRLAAKATVAKHLDPILEQLGALTIRPKAEKTVVFEPDSPPAFLKHVEAADAADAGIPDFLKRAREEVANEMIDTAADILRKEIADTKKAKAAGRIAKMKAKKAGDLKKMPLTGKAALDAIRNG